MPEKVDKIVSKIKASLREEHPDWSEDKIEEVAWATYNSKFKKEKYSFDSILEVKEVDDELIVKGYIATTHFDGQDIITKETLELWAKEINEGNPRANKVSINHNRTPHVAGKGLKGTARVDVLPDGEFGLYVETVLDKTREDFNEIKYRVDNGFLDSFSIEYIAPEECKFINGARILGEETTLYGWTLASQPMNENAVMIKELLNLNSKESESGKDEESKTTEENKMPEEIKSEAVIEQVVDESKEESKTEEIVAEEKTTEINVESKESAIEAKESFEKFKEEVRSEVKEALNAIKIEEKTMINKEDKMESKELKDYKEIFEKEVSIYSQFKRAGDIVSKEMITRSLGNVNFEKKSSSFSTNGNKIEYKGLGINTNQNTDTDYLLSSAELSDVFDPVIYNYLNQKTTTWSLLNKDNYSGKGNNMVQFTLKTGKNSSAQSYTGNAIATGNVSRLKYETRFKKYSVGVAIDGDMITASMGGPIGDIFSQEVMDSTDDLMEVMNAALYAEVGLETAAGVIGFEYITDSAGNTTLYNLTRSAANLLAPDSATDTYINGSSADVSVTLLRQAIRQAIEEGADLSNLVFFCSPVQYDKIKSIYDSIQRMVPTSARFGFEGRIDFEGVPVFYDKDCNDDDIFLVDLDTHRIAIFLPPTLEMFGKSADSVEGFIKTYWCTYNKAPRRMVQIYGLATA